MFLKSLASRISEADTMARNMSDEEKAKLKEEMMARKEAWRNKFRGEA